MGLLRFVQTLARHRFFWFLLFYFQYELRLPPCVNCVYERALYLTFIIAGFIGFLCPSNFVLRNLANLTFMAGSAGGVLVAFDHLTSVYQTGFGASCQLKAQFPSYLKLDEWLPWMFEPTATCAPLDWSLLGFSMPEWIILSFACGLIVSVLFFFSEFVKRRRRGYIDFYR